MDREGHLLTFADLGRDRGSFDWLSPVVFSGLVLHVELCDRQRNRAGGVTDGDGPGEIGSLGTHLRPRRGGRAVDIHRHAIAPVEIDPHFNTLVRQGGTLDTSGGFAPSGRAGDPRWQWLGRQLLGRGTGVGRCRGRVVGEGTACEQACCSTQSEHGNLATDPTDAGAAPSSGRGATTHVLPVQWWRCQVRVSRAAPMTARPVSIEAWLSDTGSTVPSAPVRGRLGLPDREG